MYEITTTPAVHVADSLRMVLALADAFRACEQEEISAHIEVWLLNNEVFVLEKLERYTEADSLVTRFFANYFAHKEITDYYRAKFYLWRLHLSARNGRESAMIRDYTHAQKYAYALDPPRRASLMADGAHAYMRIGEHETALLLTEEAQALIDTAQTYDEQTIYARVLLIGAEATLWLGENLTEAKTQFTRAATLYSTLGDTSKVATAFTLLGKALAAEGDTTAALAQMENAADLARLSGNQRNRIYSQFYYGQLLRESGDLQAAELILANALDASRTTQEFYLFLAYELALLYDERRQLEQATRYYQVVLDAPRPKALAASIEAELKAREAENRLLMIKSDRDRTTIGILLLILLAIGFVFLFRKRRLSVLDYAKGGVFIPVDMPTGLTLDELKTRFREAVNSKMLGRRLAYIYAVLYDANLIRSYITNAYLWGQIEADRLKNSTAVFHCAALIEMAVDGEDFSDTQNPANTIGSYLRTEFGKRDWPWPTYPMDWKRYFMEYHLDSVFPKES